ncbi:gliding motility-associated peptidyl-prolyl isomerase GldI [Flavobacterium sp.]
MKINKNTVGLLLFCLVIVSCKQPQVRMPISQSSGTFMKESIVRNKKLIAGEEAKIDSIIKSTPNIKYFTSNKGYWYHYDIKNDKDTLRPKKGDIAYFNYEVQDLKGNVIYSEIQTKPQIYKVDKQNIMMGLRHGIKLMRKNEKVVFLFPSHMAYGYHGDNKNIGTNEPLLCIVTLNDFTPENKTPSTNILKNE